MPCNNDQNIVELYMDGDSSIFVESDFFFIHLRILASSLIMGMFDTYQIS